MPGEPDRNREAEHGRGDERDHHPARHAERLERDVRDLQQQPRDHRIARRDAEDAALAKTTQESDGTVTAHVLARGVRDRLSMHRMLLLLVLERRDRRPCEAVPAKGLGHAPSQVVLLGTQAGHLRLEALVALQPVEDWVGLEQCGRKG